MTRDLKTYPRTDGQGGENAHVLVHQPSSVKARQFKFSWNDILNKNKKLVTFRAMKTFIRKKMGHTT